MSNFQRMLASQIKRINTDSLTWAFPAALGLGWFLWPALDYEWKMEMGLAPDPEAGMNKVHDAKLARMEALQIAKHGPSAATRDAAVEKEEEADEETEEETNDEEEDAPAADEEDADEAEEDESEGEEIVIKPLFIPTKAEKLGPQEIWDNFTIKALNMSEDDDDEEEEEEEEEEEDEEE